MDDIINKFSNLDMNDDDVLDNLCSRLQNINIDDLDDSLCDKFRNLFIKSSKIKITENSLMIKNKIFRIGFVTNKCRLEYLSNHQYIL